MGGRDRKKTIAASWERNAPLWTQAVRAGAIPSRRAGTDDAIVAAITALQPACFLDVGCGEGWLVRRVAAALACEAVGIDGAAALIGAAKAADAVNRYAVLAYDDLVAGRHDLDGPFDAIAFNFALFEADIAPVLAAVRELLAPEGAIVIQTVHPQGLSPEDAAADGWRREDFSAFAGQDWVSMPWYFHTVASWRAVIATAGLQITSLGEPAAEAGAPPLSLLITCQSAP